MPIRKDNRLLRVGVLGAGPIAQAAHFEACRKARNAELYAVCDRAEDLLERVRATHEPRTVYADYAAMLADERLEAVIVATADAFHAPAALRALEAGKHVLVEKPLGVSVEECQALEAKAAQAGLVVQVGTMKRFDPGIAFARDFIAAQLGEVLAIKAWYADSTYRYAMTDNLQPILATSAQAIRPATDPKADKRRYFMLTHGSHLVDTMRYLGGPIESVQARHLERFGAHSWFADVAFASGALGHLDLTVAVRMDWHEGFQVYGEHGSVLGKTYNPWYLRSSDVECFNARTGRYERPLGEDAGFYRLQLEGFASAILEGTPMRGATASEGTDAVRAMVALARSSEKGERVRLADATGAV